MKNTDLSLKMDFLAIDIKIVENQKITILRLNSANKFG